MRSIGQEIMNVYTATEAAMTKDMLDSNSMVHAQAVFDSVFTSLALTIQGELGT